MTDACSSCFAGDHCPYGNYFSNSFHGCDAERCDEYIEREIEAGRNEYYSAWFEYISDFD